MDKEIIIKMVKSMIGLNMSTKHFVPFYLSQEEYDEIFIELEEEERIKQQKLREEEEYVKQFLPKPEEAINYKSKH